MVNQSLAIVKMLLQHCIYKERDYLQTGFNDRLLMLLTIDFCIPFGI